MGLFAVHVCIIYEYVYTFIHKHPYMWFYLHFTWHHLIRLGRLRVLTIEAHDSFQGIQQGLACLSVMLAKLQCSFFYLRLFESKVWSYFVVLFPGTHSALVTCKSWANNLGTSLVILIPTIELYCTVEKDIVDGRAGKSATYVHSSFHFVQALMRHPFSGRSIGTSPASKNSQNDPLCDNVCITIDYTPLPPTLCIELHVPLPPLIRMTN